MDNTHVNDLKKGRRVSITLKSKGYYSTNSNGNDTEIFNKSNMEKKLLGFKDNTRWSEKIRQESYEHAGIKSIKTFNAELIEDYKDKLRVKNLEDDKYFLLNKEQIKQMKRYTKN
jgi:hypothetical protein